MIRSHKKKPRTDILNDPGVSLFFPEDLNANSLDRGEYINLSGRSSDLWINLIASAFPPILRIQFVPIDSGLLKAFVPTYSGGPVPDFHRCSLLSTMCT